MSKLFRLEDFSNEICKRGQTGKKLISNKMICQATSLYSSGSFEQALTILKSAAIVDPSNHEIYYLTGLIHEDMNNYEKALNAYFLSGLLANSTKNVQEKTIWNRVYNISKHLKDDEKMMSALDKVTNGQDSFDTLKLKMKFYVDQNFVPGIISTEIDMMKYEGVNIEIFTKIDLNIKQRYRQRVFKHLFNLIKIKGEIIGEEFIIKSIHFGYKAKSFRGVLILYENFYKKLINIVNIDVLIIYIHSFIAVGSVSKPEKVYLINEDYLDDSVSGEIEQINGFNLIKEKIKNPFNNLINLLNMKSKFNIYYMKALMQLYMKMEDYKTAKELCGYAIKYDKKDDSAMLLVEIFIKLNEYTEACSYLNQLLYKDPTNIKIKAKLFEIYNNLGNDFIAGKYKSFYEIYSNINLKENNKHIWTPDACQLNKFRYFKVLDAFHRGVPVHNYTNELLDDFFNNPFILQEDTKFESFYNKLKDSSKLKVISKETMMLTNVSGVVNEIAMVEDNTIKEVLKISSLHGLEIKEWSFIVKESIKSLYKELLYEQALEIVIKSLKTKLLEEKFFIGLLGIKIAIKSRSLSELIILIRYFCKTYNYTFYYFYCYLLRHINRYENSSEYTQFNRMIQRKMLKDNNPDTLPLLIYTYLPRFNFVNTITDLADNFQTDNFNINLIIGALLIGHSRSRRAKFPKKLVQRGFKRLNDLTENTQEEIDYKNYNMGKAFHYLGLISKAECFYFKVLDSENVCLKRMAIYNLSLLWKNNKSNALIRHILNKY